MDPSGSILRQIIPLHVPEIRKGLEIRKKGMSMVTGMSTEVSSFEIRVTVFVGQE